MLLRRNPDEPLGRPVGLTGGGEHRGGRAWSCLHGQEAGDIVGSARRRLAHGAALLGTENENLG